MQWQHSLRKVEQQAASERNALKAESDRLKALLRQGSQVIAQLQSTEAALRLQLANSQRQLADTRANRAASQLFAGLAGAMIGRAIE